MGRVEVAPEPGPGERRAVRPPVAGAERGGFGEGAAEQPAGLRPAGQHANVVRGRVRRQAGGEVAVAARAQGQLPDEEEVPPFADDVQGSGDGACVPVVLHKSHGMLCFCKCQLH